MHFDRVKKVCDLSNWAQDNGCTAEIGKIHFLVTIEAVAKRKKMLH